MTHTDFKAGAFDPKKGGGNCETCRSFRADARFPGYGTCSHQANATHASGAEAEQGGPNVSLTGGCLAHSPA